MFNTYRARQCLLGWRTELDMDGLDPIADLRRSAEERAHTEAERERVRKERRARLAAAARRQLSAAGDRARAVAVGSSQAGLRVVRATPAVTKRSLALLAPRLALFPRRQPRAAGS